MELKRVKVHMLPTEDNSNILTTTMGNLVYSSKKLCSDINFNPQHLYFTTEDEIKEGDWCIEFDDEKWQHLYQPINTKWDMVSKANYCRKRGTVRKIIATTDKSLCIEQEVAGENIGVTFLSQPSSAFVEKYIELGGIDEVNVEYEKDYYTSMMLSETRAISNWNYKLKVDSHNTITIHPIKDSWNKIELDYQIMIAVASFAAERGLTPMAKDMKVVNDWTTNYCKNL